MVPFAALLSASSNPKCYNLMIKSLSVNIFRSLQRGEDPEVEERNEPGYKDLKLKIISTFQRILTPENEAALSLEVRKFFASNLAKPTPLYTKEVEDLTFEEIEVLLKIQQAMITTHFQGHGSMDGLSARNPLTTEQLKALFLVAAKKGVDSIVTEIIQGPRCVEISPEDLGEALRTAAEYGRAGCVQALIGCEHFGEISPEDLGEALRTAAKAGREGCVQALIGCGRFGEILPEDLGMALKEAGKAGREGCVQLLSVAEALLLRSKV